MKKMSNTNALKAIDLFSGCGGMSFGFEEAGINTILAVDNWADALSTFEKNHPKSKTRLYDLGSDDNSTFLASLPAVDIVFGGPPCQGFSISGKRDPNDPRNKLYKGFFQVVKHLKPSIFVMENVPNLVAMDNGRLIAEIENDFRALGYEITRQILLASDFGVPQNRKRLILVGTLSKIPFVFPEGQYGKSLNKVNCYDALSDLPEESVIDGSVYQIKPGSEYQRQMRINSSGVYNHEISRHSKQTIEIISQVPDGGNYKNLPKDLQEIRKVNIAWTRYSSTKPSLTIDTGHRHHFHYKYNRIPTVRESARLQSFPDCFVFTGSKTSQYKQVGNAVPPILAKEIGFAIVDYLRMMRGTI